MLSYRYHSLTMPVAFDGDPEASFDAIKIALLGETQIQVPRVSRETIIAVLQSHTDLLKSFKADHNMLARRVLTVESDQEKNKKLLNDLNAETEKNRKEIQELFRINDNFRKEMDELSAKVAELFVLKNQLTSQKEQLDDLSTRYNTFSVEVAEFMLDQGRTVDELKTQCNDTTFMLKEVKDYVDHFGDNLILNSSQIMVDPSAGFSVRPQSLTDTMAQCNTQFTEATTLAEEQGESIKDIYKELDMKAPDTALSNIAVLEKKVTQIEIHLAKEEEQGIGAIRKACEELQVNQQTMTTELADKIDRDSVGFIVHEKYEEIVRYLQDALQSSLEDENSFKKKADDIQEMVVLLSHSKADRSEIANMQELMVKTEAMMKKVGAQTNIKDRLNDMVTKKEYNEGLDRKVDKDLFEANMGDVIASLSKKGRKLGSIQFDSLKPVEDGINKPGVKSMQIHKDMLKAQEAANALMKYEDSRDQDAPQREHSGWNPDGSMIEHRAPEFGEDDTRASPPVGGSGTAALGLRPGKSDRKTPGGTPVIAIGRTLSPPKGVKDSADFSSFVKNKKTMVQSASAVTLNPSMISSSSTNITSGGKKGSTLLSVTSSLPSGVRGGFRAGSEHGRAPGSPGHVGVHVAQGTPASEGYGNTVYPYVPPAYDATYEEKSKQTDSLAYLTGNTAGGGYNLHAGQLQQGHTTSKTVYSEDVEGKGLMVKGADGQMYYKDLNDDHK